MPQFAQRSLLCLLAFTCVFHGQMTFGDVTLPNIFSDSMVLQRDQPNKIWGKASPGETIQIEIAGASTSATADPQGFWSAMLPALPVGGPHELTIKGDNKVTINDVLVGEVWVCSGQSNMEWPVNSANNADLEKLAANYPKIRMVNFPNVGTQTPVWSHDEAKWLVCNPENVGTFSAVGYFFARQLHQTLDVPIGMINNAWGGSACEAWVDRSVLKKAGGYDALLEAWDKRESDLQALESGKNLDAAKKKQIASQKGALAGNQNPGNIYNGVLKSHLGYGMRGVIWYQGESNAKRAYQYRKLFPLMISTWRSEWNQGDFPFYWVQLADFRDEVAQPAESDWAELREAQTMAMKALPKTGQAVIIDIGEGKDIHPKNKVDVGMRLARWAMANEYGVKIPFRSPEYKAMSIVDDKVKLEFEYLGNGWRPFDTAQPQGFAIAGEDRKFVWATAAIETKDNSVLVSSPLVKNPVAVRYAWGDNPVCNMYSVVGLPLTPFRTDDWPGVTANATAP